ncbi:MAG TPA: CBS domain-containing protein [Fimbriimonadaceae bacterium]|nr:CBS domain-containing protein [Fimbriimonadaceae bacterium]
MRLHDVMTTEVKTIEAQASLAEAAMTMKLANVGFLPVIGPTSKPIGVITDRDITIRSLADGLSPNAQVRLAMSPAVHIVREDDDLQAALDLMKDKKVGRVLIADKYGSLVGVLSLNDATILCNGDTRTAQVCRALRSRVSPSRWPEVLVM